MAILYGTQSNGETLPVLVDQFGNLLAKGIEGAPGPPGPPGVGELPPDPFEGAILGWEDGELAWLGGSVPLPAGTYGPYTYIPGNEQLDIPQDASSLVNGQQLYMSDEKGDPVNVEYRTDTIASVVGFVPTWNQDYVWSDYWDEPMSSSAARLDGFNGVTPSRSYLAGTFSTWTSPATLTVNRQLRIRSHTYSNGLDEDKKVFEVNGTNYYNLLPEYVYGTAPWVVIPETTLTSIKISGYGSGTEGSVLGGIEIDGLELVDQGITGDPGAGPLLTFPTDNNFDKFEVGDVIQTESGAVSITAIDDTVPSITVDGGSFSGSDGSGSGGDTYLETEWSGAGSVFVGLDGAIVLRNNNKQWVNDFYVTAPEQVIAARKVAANARKLRKK